MAIARRGFFLLPLLLAACGDNEDTPPPNYPPLSFDYLGPLRIDVGRIEIDDHWVPRGGAKHVEFLAPMTILGRGGRSLNEAWSQGAQAWLGITVPGFPNFFMIYGPNTNLGHNSIVFMLECQVAHVMRCLRRLRAANFEVRVLADLRRQGLIRHIGLSNVTANQVAEAQTITDVVCVQNNYNLAHRHDDALINDLAQKGIAYVPFFPLGGFTPLQSATLSKVAGRLGATPMQVALAWLLHRSPNILLIPGTSSVAHLRENLAAWQVALTPETMVELNGIAGESARVEH